MDRVACVGIVQRMRLADEDMMVLARTESIESRTHAGERLFCIY